ncbi:MAG TPA: DUF2071 domain-containing protein [Bryobacteraceae bacterium]|nr:DUF2071 domain-containing protein [Bryobacteraceae bacterium]
MSPDPDTRVDRPIMRQDWRVVSFLHWRVDPALIRGVIPPQLEPDVFDGAAWIGLVPFLIENLSTPQGPQIPWLSRFPETNVRTYVVDGAGRRGVWFLSLDAARWPAVIGARTGFGLPYYWAWMSVRRSGETARYASRRLTMGGGRCCLTIGIGNPLSHPSELEIFLTARFRLFAEWRRRLFLTEISHQRWPLQTASVLSLKEDLVEKAGVAWMRGAPLVHFAAGVDVIVAPPKPL